MPTYRNNGNTIKIITNSEGKDVEVKPGRTVQTYDVLTDSDLVKTSDAPYWNPVKAVSSPVGDAETDYELTLQTTSKKLTIINGSDQTATVYFQSKSNTPGVPVPAGSTYKMTDDPFYERASKLIFAFSGAVASGVTVIETE